MSRSVGQGARSIWMSPTAVLLSRSLCPNTMPVTAAGALPELGLTVHPIVSDLQLALQDMESVPVEDQHLRAKREDLLPEGKLANLLRDMPHAFYDRKSVVGHHVAVTSSQSDANSSIVPVQPFKTSHPRCLP